MKVTNDDGVRRSFYCSVPGRAGQLECNHKADEWLRYSVAAIDTRCARLIERWLDEFKAHSSTSDYNQRESISRLFIKPAIGRIKFSKLKKQDLQKIIDDAYAKGYSKKYLQNIRGTLSKWLKSCPETPGMRLSTDEIIILTDAPVKQKEILQPDAIAVLFNDNTVQHRGKAEREWYINAWRFAVVSGLRPGEDIALEKRYVSAGKARVRGSVNVYQEHTKGKNNNAIRDIVLPMIADEIVEAQCKMLRAAGIVSPYLFPAPDGKCARQQTVALHWKKYCIQHGLPHVTLYGLRHTFVSVTAGKANVTLAELKALVGHSKNMDTLGVYGHALTDAEKQIAQKLGCAFTDIIHGNE